MDSLIQGLYDLHIHASPDIMPRKMTDLELARKAVEAGMEGLAIKAHYVPTADRAYIVKQLFPELNVVGGIVLNHPVGGINPYAVECCALSGGRIVWFPTMDSMHCLTYVSSNIPQHLVIQNRLKEAGSYREPVRILDDRGKLLPSALEVLEVVAYHDMCLATGHLSPEESVALVDAAAEMGIKKILVTHVNWPATHFDEQAQKELVKKGALMEYSFSCSRREVLPFEAETIRKVGAENCVITTDLGQVNNISPAEGLAAFVRLLLELGYNEREIETIGRINPRKLIER